MRNYFFPLAAVLVLSIACSSQAAENPRPAQGNQNQPKKVWTNDDMDQLRSRGLISIVGQEPAQAAAHAPAAAAEPAPPVYESRFDDPAWYAAEAADLRAELETREAALNEQLTAMALAVDRITQPGVALDKPSVGVTPAEGVVILQARVQEVQDQLEELSDLARQHNIEPGVLRG
ncbi:MAG TPA: hypothetical protein VGI34_09810 [Candidatus Acidoferrales bacterium]|jgi:pyruvate/2-oxoglutarate dehydrogenase complex dihydrolipoamide acyltransferase (E2) component